MSQVLLTQPSTDLELDPTLKETLFAELQPQTLDSIRKGFALWGSTVDVGRFVVVLLESLCAGTAWTAKKREVLAFIEVFFTIDIRDSKQISFSDFTTHLISKEKSEGECQQQIVRVGEKECLETSVERLFTLSGCPFFAVLEPGRKTVVLVTSETMLPLRTLSLGGRVINAVAFLPRYQVYCLAANDKSLTFLQTHEFTPLQRLQLPQSPAMLLPLEGLKPRLIVATNNGYLYELDLKVLLGVERDGNRDGKKEIRPQQRNVTFKDCFVGKNLKTQPDITCVDRFENEWVVTGCHDARIRLYQCREQGLVLTKELQGHQKGVKGVAVSKTQRCIVSCGYDFDLFVWNAYLEHPVARLQGHEASLMAVECPQSHFIIVSLDSKGILRTWNLQNFQPLQVLGVTETQSPFLAYKEDCDLFLIYLRKIHCYKYKKNFNPRLTDDGDLSALCFSRQHTQLYVGSRRALKVWCLQRGLLLQHYNNVVSADISVLTLDACDRRCFIGTVEGHICAIDLLSGQIVAKFSSHSQEVAFLAYCGSHQLLLSGGWERRIAIHNDTQHLQAIEGRENVLRNINQVSDKELAAGCFSSAELLIATHCRTRSLRLWDFQKGYLETELLLPHEVGLIIFLEPLPILLIADCRGGVFLFGSRCHQTRPYALLAHWRNMFNIQRAAALTCAFVANPPSQVVIGDEFGFLRLFDFGQLLSEVNPITPEILGNKNPYRIEDYTFKSGGQQARDYSQIPLPSIVIPTGIKQLLQLKAHSQKVTFVCIIEASNRLLLSAGSDGLVKLWNEQGETQGLLKQGQQVNRNWSFFPPPSWHSKEWKTFQTLQEQLSSLQYEFKQLQRKQWLPFSEEQTPGVMTNDQIYQDLKEVEEYLQRNQVSKRNF